MRRLCLSFCATFWVLFLGVSDVGALECRLIESCGKCIQNVNPPCSWCEDEVYVWLEQPRDRCDSLSNHTRNRCQKIANPSSRIVTHEDKLLDPDVKVKPQNVTLSLRPG
ncbi:integrin beta-6-like [Montipora foliosa]